MRIDIITALLNMIDRNTREAYEAKVKAMRETTYYRKPLVEAVRFNTRAVSIGR